MPYFCLRSLAILTIERHPVSIKRAAKHTLTVSAEILLATLYPQYVPMHPAAPSRITVLHLMILRDS